MDIMCGITERSHAAGTWNKLVHQLVLVKGLSCIREVEREGVNTDCVQRIISL